VHRNPRQVIPHHAAGCREHNGCASDCAVRAFVARYWNLYDDAILYAKRVGSPKTVASMEAMYGG
jgi:hypothetical protein